MKKIYDKIISNGRQILEIIILILATSIPWIVDLKDIFKDYLSTHPMSPDDFFWQVALRNGNIIASIVLFFAVLYLIRLFNHEFVMNRKRVYHDYSYAWYWFCAKVLGINSCDLVLVPIYMQFKLVIRATFQNYPLDEMEYPEIENEMDSKVMIYDGNKVSREINLILEDTYPVDIQQIPRSKRGYKTFKVIRNSGTDNTRHFSQKFINAIIKCVRGINGKKKAPEDEKIFVRYDEGAKRYSMCRNSFMRLAADAGAVYKINKISLVNIKIFEEYLETFRVEN